MKFNTGIDFTMVDLTPKFELIYTLGKSTKGERVVYVTGNKMDMNNDAVVNHYLRGLGIENSAYLENSRIEINDDIIAMGYTW